MNRWVLQSLLLLVASLALSACGSGVSGTAGDSVAKSTSCFTQGHAGIGASCHQESRSPGTGELIVAEWQRSIHYNSKVAGCIDCHEADTNHYCMKCHGGISGQPVKNPDLAGKCYKCHGLAHPKDRMIAEAPSHFGNVTSTNNNRYLNYDRASYVSGKYVGLCRKCHNPHDPSTFFAYNQKWAESGMGDPNAAARKGGSRRGNLKLFGTDVPATEAFFYANPSFQGANTAEQNAEAAKAYQQFGNSNTLLVRKTASSPYVMQTFTPGCVRCHTTTGNVNFVNSGFKSLKAFDDGDPSKEVTGCDACHDGYAFKTRNVPAVTIYYNFSSSYSSTSNAFAGSVKLQSADGTATTYTDFGVSNMCVPCHSGRGRGAVINLLVGKADAAGINLYSNTAIPGTHDFASAGILDRRLGYEFPGKDYTETAKHNTIRMSGSGKKGPCVGCHMNTAGASANSHLFMSVEHGAKFAPISTSWSYNASADTPISNTVASVVSRECSGCHGDTRTGAFLTTQKTGYLSALTALKSCVSLVISSGNYTKIGTTSADYAKTMGAGFNASYLGNEPGAYVHSPQYTKRLIYDSIDWLRTAPAIDQPSVEAALTWLTTQTSSGKQYMTKKAADDAKAWLGSTRP